MTDVDLVILLVLLEHIFKRQGRVDGDTLNVKLGFFFFESVLTVIFNCFSSNISLT